MRLDRLLGMTLELMSRKRMTAAELAAKFEVSIRTVYRDIELIDQAGIPVASFTGADGGFELMNGFFLTRQYFSVDDLSVVYMLLKAMEGAMGSAVRPAMRKLASLSPELANDGICEAVILSIGTSDYERSMIQKIFEAVRQSHVVELGYTSASGTATERSVEPLNLMWEKGVWYLEGYCRLRKSKRFFRVSRISSLEVSDEKFIPRQFSNEPERDESPKICTHLRFDPTVRTRVLEQFPGECTYLENAIEVHTTFYNKDYALSVIASYGMNVEIVSPPELEKDFIAHIEMIRQHYSRKRGGHGT